MTTKVEIFEQAIREFGVEAALEYFGVTDNLKDVIRESVGTALTAGEQKEGEIKKQAWELGDHKDCLELVSNCISALIVHAKETKTTLTLTGVANELIRINMAIEISLAAYSTKAAAPVVEDAAKESWQRHAILIENRWMIDYDIFEKIIKELAGSTWQAGQPGEAVELWNDKTAMEFAELYRFSSSRISIEQFIQSKNK